jgi:hypothetical protein
MGESRQGPVGLGIVSCVGTEGVLLGQPLSLDGKVREPT